MSLYVLWSHVARHTGEKYGYNERYELVREIESYGIWSGRKNTLYVMFDVGYDAGDIQEGRRKQKK